MKYVLIVLEINDEWNKMPKWKQAFMQYIYYPVLGYDKLKTGSITLCTGDILTVYSVPGPILESKKCKDFLSKTAEEFDIHFLPHEDDYNILKEDRCKSFVRLMYWKQMVDDVRKKYVINEDNMHIAITADNDSVFLRKMLDDLKYCGRFFSIRMNECHVEFLRFANDFIADNGIDLNVSTRFDKKIDCDVLIELGSNKCALLPRQSKVIRLFHASPLVTRRIVVEQLEVEGLKVDGYTEEDIKLFNYILEKIGYYTVVVLMLYLKSATMGRNKLKSILSAENEYDVLGEYDFVESCSAVLKASGITFSKCSI